MERALAEELQAMSGEELLAEWRRLSSGEFQAKGSEHRGSFGRATAVRSEMFARMAPAYDAHLKRKAKSR